MNQISRFRARLMDSLLNSAALEPLSRVGLSAAGLANSFAAFRSNVLRISASLRAIPA